MVEFSLIFFLGFLTALLLGLFLAPAVHGRIVRYTERRIQATVPMSPRELRAARDMERAAFAAESARIKLDLDTERQRRIDETKKADRLRETAARMRGEIAELVQQVDAMSVAAGDLRSNLRQNQKRGDTLKLKLSDAERTIADRERHVIELDNDVRRLTIDLEDMRIDLATRETEAESLKSTIDAGNEERRRIRDQLAELQKTAKDGHYRLAREAERAASLEGRLAEALSKLSDQENRLERRDAEIDRLKEKIRNKAAQLKSANQNLRRLEKENGQLEDRARRERRGSIQTNGQNVMNGSTEKDDGSRRQALHGRAAIGQRVEQLRARHAALVERLMTADEQDDDELREEIKDIAAGMIDLTATREGDKSPIHQILANTREDEVGGAGSTSRSLAARAKSVLGGR